MQPAPTAQRGTYLVYVEDSGAAFVSREPSLVEAGVWPLEFYYFQDSEVVGSAKMAANANCGLGVINGRLTHVNGSAVPDEGLSTPAFTFDRAAGGGDAAIVNFVCGEGEASQTAEMPITGSVAETIASYRALAATGIESGVAARLAIRDPEAATALAPDDRAGGQVGCGPGDTGW